MLLFGDIHNHNAHGYGMGTIERSIEIATEHLDFFAFTGHSSWHDLTPIEGDRHKHFTEGFKRLRETWPRVQERIREANTPGRFCSFLGFEWHSNRFGDQCVIFPDDDQPICYTSELEKLRAFCVEHGALMIPHHLAYPRGRRGVNWDVFDPACTPVVEIFSFHGNSEHDRGPSPMLRGSPGGRQTSNTVRAALAKGLRFGFVASTDNHLGFPGAHGEGLLSVEAKTFDRAGILSGIRARRTCALTGDRMRISASLNGRPIGSDVPPAPHYEFAADIEACDEIDVIELVADGKIVKRWWPDIRTTTSYGDCVGLLRFQWGWGPWGDLALTRVTDWEMDLVVEGGRFTDLRKMLRGGPFDPDRRHRIRQDDERMINITSYSSRKQAFQDVACHAITTNLHGDLDTIVEIRLKKPREAVHRVSVRALLEGSANFHVGEYGTESFQLDRIVTPEQSNMNIATTLGHTVLKDYAYLRVRQMNEQLGWTSPFFIGAQTRPGRD